MKFDLKRPCGNCPFRYDRNGYITQGRAEEIAEMLVGGGTFSCHKTNDVDEEGDTMKTKNSQHCAGALIMLEHMEQPNQMMRIAGRLGMYDRTKLDMDAPVFEDDWDFIAHHEK